MCLPCQIAGMKRSNAILRGEKHALGMAEKCELHASLFSARIENQLRTAQVLHEEIDSEARAVERAKTEKVIAGKPAVPFVIPRKLGFPYGTPSALRAMARLSPQMDYAMDVPRVSGRERELSLLRDAALSGKIRRIG